MRDLARQLPDGARVSIITAKSGAAGARPDPPRRRARARGGRAGAVSGRQDLDRPGDRRGLLLRLRVPGGTAISEADFPAIEERMRAHVKAAEAFERRDVAPAQARERFLGGAPGLQGRADRRPRQRRASPRRRRWRRVSLYTNGPFTDLCRGPHAPSTKTVGGVQAAARSPARTGAGTPTRTMLTRIYGTAFFSKAELDGAPRADRAGEGARPPQARARARAVQLLRGLARRGLLAAGGDEHVQLAGARVARDGPQRGYSEVKTPQIFDAELWKTSGHWGKYRENMFTVQVEDREMGVKPMNCPGHAHLFGSTPPLLPRPAGAATPSRACCTATRRRGCCTGCCACATSRRTTRTSSAPRSRSRTRSRAVCEMAFATYELFDFDVSLELSTRPEQRVGSDEMWDRAEQKLTSTLEELGLDYELNPGDGAFYGPEDRHAHDRLARALLAAGDGAARLLDARALRAGATPARTTRSTAR